MLVFLKQALRGQLRKGPSLPEQALAGKAYHAGAVSTSSKTATAPWPGTGDRHVPQGRRSLMSQRPTLPPGAGSRWVLTLTLAQRGQPLSRPSRSIQRTSLSLMPNRSATSLRDRAPLPRVLGSHQRQEDDLPLVLRKHLSPFGLRHAASLRPQDLRTPNTSVSRATAKTS